MKALGVEAGRSAEAELRERRHDAARPCGQRRHQPGDVLEQNRERQRAQVAFDVQGAKGFHQAVTNGVEGRPGQAHPLGCPRAAGSERDLDRAGRRGNRKGVDVQQGKRLAGDLAVRTGKQRPGACRERRDEQGVDACSVECMSDLRLAEEERQGYVHDAAERCRLVGHGPCGRVVEQRRQHPRPEADKHVAQSRRLLSKLTVLKGSKGDVAALHWRCRAGERSGPVHVAFVRGDRRVPARDGASWRKALGRCAACTMGRCS